MPPNGSKIKRGEAPQGGVACENLLLDRKQPTSAFASSSIDRCPLCLKIEFQTQLYFARRRSQKCNRAERAATEIGIGRSEVWVIKYIEGFKSKFQASTFPQTRKREFLKERHGNILAPRLTYARQGSGSVAEGKCVRLLHHAGSAV